MSKVVTLYEYTPIKLSDPGLASLSASFLDSFHSYIERTYSNQPLAVERTQLKPRSLVGTLCYRDRQFEILPKLIGEDSESSKGLIYKNLLTMLSLTKNVKVSETEIQKLGKTLGGLLEIYIKLFAENLERLIFLKPHRAYASRDENLNCVRGRVLFQENTKLNFVHRERFYCSYDEYTEDNELNRLFKFVGDGLLGVTSAESTYAKLKIIESHLSEVGIEAFTPARANRITLNRQNAHYEICLSLAQMFVGGLSPEPRAGGSRNIGILFDMNKLFEEFIFALLFRQRTVGGFDVRSQKKSSLAIAHRDFSDEEFTTANSFGTRSDILITLPDGSLIVVDTKYKLLDLDNRKSFDVSHGDVYQVLAYASILSRGGLKVLPVLLYPQPDAKANSSVTRMFKTSGDSPQQFLVMTVSLFEDLTVAGARKSIVERIISTCAASLAELVNSRQ